jgi:hypothetical protein
LVYTRHGLEGARALNRAICLLVLAVASHAAQDCPRAVAVDGSLQDIANRYLGSPRFAIAIALATNARSDKFAYISNPDDLNGVKQICIPSKSEARLMLRNWEAFDKAVAGTRLPRKSSLRNEALVEIPPEEPVTFVAWVRKNQTDKWKTPLGGWKDVAADYLWVTKEPYLQQFCSKLVRDHKLDEAALTRRLEQRLGLPPASNKVYFVRIRIQHPDSDVVFRPCNDPAPNKANCSAGSFDKAPAWYQEWFYKQYYSSYGSSLFSEAPWTALGYTFDWAPVRSSPAGFERLGESEFVIRKGAPIEILNDEDLTTLKYCSQPRETTSAALR